MASVKVWQEIDTITQKNSAPLFAIGDIHAQRGLLAAAFDAVVEQLPAPSEGQPTVVLLGDLIDRGEAVIDTLDQIQLFQRSYPGVLKIVRGNHEETFCAFVERRLSAGDFLEWLDLYGGRETLEAIGITRVSAIEGYWNGGNLLPTEEARALYLTCCRSFEEVVVGTIGFTHTPAQARALVDARKLERVIHGHMIVEKVASRDGLINLELGSYTQGKVGVLYIHSGKLATTTVRVP